MQINFFYDDKIRKKKLYLRIFVIVVFVNNKEKRRPGHESDLSNDILSIFVIQLIVYHRG